MSVTVYLRAKQRDPVGSGVCRDKSQILDIHAPGTQELGNANPTRNGASPLPGKVNVAAESSTPARLVLFRLPALVYRHSRNVARACRFHQKLRAQRDRGRPT